MAEQSVEIPNRAAFKASEVCEIAQIPSYVLRSWEKEFPRLGAAARPGGPRIYNRADVEQILRIKQLVFAEGLTLAGARRRLEGDPPDEEPELPYSAPVSEDVRVRVTQAKQGLRSILDLLSQPVAPGAGAPGAGAPDATAAAPKPRRPKRGAKEAREDAASKVE